MFDLSKIKVVVSEVNGVLVESTIYDSLGFPVGKNIREEEFEFINSIKSNFDVIFLSLDPNITHSILRNKNLPFFVAKKSKKETLIHIMNRYQVTPEEVLYIHTNTPSDLGCAQLIPSHITIREDNYFLSEDPGAYELTTHYRFELVDNLLKSELKRRIANVD